MHLLRVLAAGERWTSLLDQCLRPHFAICNADEPAELVIVVAGAAAEMPPLSERLTALLRTSPEVPILMCCPQGCEQALSASIQASIRAQMDLSFSAAELVSRVRKLLGNSGIGIPPSLFRIVGKSLHVREIRNYILRVAKADTTILITGETGTGKELVAELIHLHSQRPRDKIVTVNCAAIPDSLLESELFGYERGAFTGADYPHEGKLKQAEGGTVFLDEIGDMTPFAQAKILRVMESGEIYRLGGKSRIHLNARFVAATNQKLEDLVQRGQFRKDLFYRLHVGRIHLAPLRERAEDVPLLIRHFIGYFNQRFGREVADAGEDLLQALNRYDWPGNIRELRNLVESMYLNGANGRLTSHDLPPGFHPASPLRRFPTGEREALLHALRMTNWNKSRAAEQLKWSRMTLYRKMAKYGLLAAAAGAVTADSEL